MKSIVAERIKAVVLGALCITLFLEFSLQAYFVVYRAAQAPRACPAMVGKDDSFVVLCLGNSFTLGPVFHREQSYPAALQGMFDRGRASQRVKVINGGVLTMNSAELLKNLRRNICRYKPDLILLQTGSPNYINNLHYGDFLAREMPQCLFACPKGFWARAFAHSGLFRLSVVFARQRDMLLRRAVIDDNGLQLFKEATKPFNFAIYPFFIRKNLSQVADYPFCLNDFGVMSDGERLVWLESDLREIIRVARAAGVKIMVHTYPRRVREPVPTGMFGEWIGKVNAVLEKVARENQLLFADNSGLFAGNPEYEGRDFHPNAAGYWAIAEKIYAAVGREWPAEDGIKREGSEE